MHICQEAADTKQAKTRFCNRLLPVEHTCTADLESITKLAQELAPSYFPPEADAIQVCDAGTGSSGPGAACGDPVRPAVPT
jgi:hypothetical protein